MISLEDVSKDYATPAGSFRALNRVTLDLAAGEFAAIVGKSGSGKSTLLNLMGGIDDPSAGEVRVGGTALRTLRPRQLAAWRGRTIGFVFQFFQLMPTLTAAENVMLPMDFAGTRRAAERRPRAIELLARMGVAEQADKLPATLSGGQQQRVAIARALANDPAVLLADEPTGNLDSTTAGEVLGIFRALADQGVAVVIATHERDLASLVDRRIEIADGAIRADERREAVR